MRRRRFVQVTTADGRVGHQAGDGQLRGQLMLLVQQAQQSRGGAPLVLPFGCHLRGLDRAGRRRRRRRGSARGRQSRCDR